MVGSPESLVLVPQLQSDGDGGTTVRYTVPSVSRNFLPGSSVTVRASGATVPAFSTAITVPTAITLTQPNLQAPSTTIARSADFAIAWTGGGPAGTVNFQLGQGDGENNTTVYCSAPSGAGALLIPASALGYLTPTSELGPADQSGWSVYSASEHVLTVEDWTIRVLAEPPDFVEGTVVVE
jgi:hypothetical protein